MTDLVALAFGVMFALGLVFVVAGVAGVELPSPEARASWPAELQLGADQVVLRLGIGIAAGVVIWVSTGWPVGSAVAFMFGAAAPSLIGAKARRAVQMARLEALSEWTEMLRSVLASAAGVEEAIRTTAAVAPGPIRPEVQRLALLLERERLVPAPRRVRRGDAPHGRRSDRGGAADGGHPPDAVACASSSAPWPATPAWR